MLVLQDVFEGGVLLDRIDIFAAVSATLLVIALALFFQRTKTGRALRAVADDHQAAQSIGIPLNRIWVIVWSVPASWHWSRGWFGAASWACSSRCRSSR
jgi:branched-chain amino acid transport system permease protein